MSFRASARSLFRTSAPRAGGGGHHGHGHHAAPKPYQQVLARQGPVDRDFASFLALCAGTAFVFYHLIAVPFFRNSETGRTQAQETH